MGITHSTVKAAGEAGLASEWNADHVISDELLPKRSHTRIVAASNSLDKDRADYVCDGTADQVEIMTAMDDLSVTGGTVLLLEGTYNINGELEIKYDNISLIGQGKGTKITTVANLDMITLYNQKNIKIKDLFVYGSGLNSNTGIFLYQAYDTEVESCFVENCGQNGISIYNNANRVLVSNCSIASNQGNGIFLNGSNYFIIANNIIRENNKHGISMSVQVGSLIVDNIIVDNDFLNSATYDGIWMESCDRCIVIGNVCKNNDKYEIELTNIGNIKNIVVGNSCYGTDHVGAISDLGTSTELAHNITT